MVEASAYVLEDIQKELDTAHASLSSYLRKSSRAVSAKQDRAAYEKGLEGFLGALERTMGEYPHDEELKRFYERFYAFYSQRNDLDPRDQLEKISSLLSDLKSMVHWRKMETSYGRSLGFSDFRSLRGESKKR